MAEDGGSGPRFWPMIRCLAIFTLGRHVIISSSGLSTTPRQRRSAVSVRTCPDGSPRPRCCDRARPTP